MSIRTLQLEVYQMGKRWYAEWRPEDDAIHDPVHVAEGKTPEKAIANAKRKLETRVAMAKQTIEEVIQAGETRHRVPVSIDIGNLLELQQRAADLH